MEIQNFLSEVTPILCSFLDEILPKVCQNWWDECVINKLSENQKRQISVKKIECLEQLDLAALLRIFNNNWQEISYLKNLPVEVRNYSNEVLSVRNKFAHLGTSLPNLDDIYRDADTIQRFVHALDQNDELFLKIENYKKTFWDLPNVEIVKVVPEIKQKEENKEETIGELVRRYIPDILNYCLNIDKSELTNLENEKYSKEIFGINYPFLKEVVSNSKKVDRYWKAIHSCRDRYFVVSSEWYKWNREKFIKYVQEKNLINRDELVNFLKDDLKSTRIIKEKLPANSDDIIAEIGKVQKRIPKWLLSPSQINHKILMKYMELLGQNEFVYYHDLDHQLQPISNFKGHFYQMKVIGDHNHSKVFDEINGKIYLWEPVKEIILNSLDSII